MPLYVLIVVSVTCTFLYIKVSDEWLNIVLLVKYVLFFRKLNHTMFCISQVVKLLLKYGSDSNYKNTHGLSSSNMAQDVNIKELLSTFPGSIVCNQPSNPVQGTCSINLVGTIWERLKEIYLENKQPSQIPLPINLGIPRSIPRWVLQTNQVWSETSKEQSWLSQWTRPDMLTEVFTH